MRNTIPDRRITALDGWRGISILCVVGAHLVGRRYSSHPHTDYPNIAGVLAGWGVAIFFVISGFIITRLALAEYERTDGFSIRAFYVRRLFRIIPPFYIYLLFIVVVSAFNLINQEQFGILAAAAFTCNFSNVQCGWFSGHSWTLAYEEQYYLTFPIIFYFFTKKFNIVATIIFITLVTLPFLRYILHLGNAWHVASGLAPSFSFICIGAVLAAYEEKFRRLILSRFAFCLSCVVTTMLTALLLLNSTFSFPLESTQAYILVSVNNVILPVCFAWMIGSTTLQNSKFTRFLNNPLLQFFGTISYSLYIWQMVFTAAPDLYPTNSWLLFPPLMLVMASISYYCIERPSIKLGKHLLNHTRHPIEISQPIERSI